MKNIFFTIIFIILIMLLVTLTKNYKENFSNENMIKNYNITLTLKKNDTMEKITDYLKSMYDEIDDSDDFRIKKLLSTNDNELNKSSALNNLLIVIMLVFIIEGYTNTYIEKENLRKLIELYFGNNILIKSNRNYKSKKLKEDEVSIQVPLNTLQTINWKQYNQIFDYVEKKYNSKRLYLKDILEIKKNILMQHFINNLIPIMRVSNNNDKVSIDYSKNYVKLLSKTHQTNYTTNLKDDNYFNYRYNFTINYLIEIYNNLQIKKENKKIFYNKLYSKSLSDTNISFSLIMGNLYMPSEEVFDLIIKRVYSKIDDKIKLLPNKWSKNYTNYLSNTEYYPYRFQYPLNYNCQRIWYDCSSKDRINEYYKYYENPKNNNIPSVKTYNMANLSFPYK